MLVSRTGSNIYTPQVKRVSDTKAFTGNSTSETYKPEYKHPVSKTGEYMYAISKSFKDSLKIAGRIFLEVARFNTYSTDDDLSQIFAITALIGAAAGLGVFLFTLPKKLYEANVNYFKRQKEMDVFVRSNATEKTIYEKLDRKAKTNNPENNKALTEQFMKMGIAKNKPSEFLMIA